MNLHYQVKDSSVMTLDQEPNAKDLFCSALEMPSQERQAFLLKACAGNNDLYQEVLSLLHSYEKANSFLEKPAANFAAKLILQEKGEFALASKNSFLNQLIGQVLDNKYLIETKLGQGGMGAVYQALHLGTDRPVAVKVITPHLMTNSEFVERFKREAKATGRLSHPNVINVTDFGVTNFGSNSIAYLVMEYLKGFTLGDLLDKKGKLPVSFTIDILEQICAAVNEAHSQGIIHRDLKPDNIWLEPDGRGSYYVKVLDFGLAKLYSNNLPETLAVANSTNINNIDKANTKSVDTVKLLLTKTDPSNTTTTVATDNKEFNEEAKTKPLGVVETAKNNLASDTLENVTRVGAILGTPLYMSPEQCKGGQVSIHSDIYSLGVIAYEMLAGETPFIGDFKQLINKHLNSSPASLHKKYRKVPKAISEVVLTALAKNPSERFPTAKAFAIALRANFEEERPIINQASNIYWKNFRQITNISIVINMFFVFFSSLLSTTVIQTKFHTFYDSSLQNLWCFLPMLFLLGFGKISKGAFALAVKQFQETGQIKSKTVLVKLAKYIPALLTTTLQSYLFSFLQIWKFIFPTFRTLIYHSLSAPIITLEEMRGNQAMERSKDLLTKFYSLAFSLEIRSLLIRTISFILFLFSFLISMYFTDGEMSFFPRLIITTLCTLILPGLFIVFASPLTDMAVTLLYLKSREAKGENPYKRSFSVEDSIIQEGIKFSTKRKIYTSLALIGSIVVATFSYLVIVPPFGEPLKAERPKYEKIPDSENAWIEYDLAIQSMVPVSMRLGNGSNTEKENYYALIRDNSLELTKTPGFKDLEKVAIGQAEFNSTQLALLDQHQKALEHLLLAVKRPKAQYYVEPPNSAHIPPSLIQNRALVIIACAQARRLNQEGKTSEAVELALAAYRMSTDLARDPNAFLLESLISVVGRTIAGKTLFIILHSGTTDAKTDIEIARRVSELESQIPNAYRFYQQEIQSKDATLEDILIKQDYSQVKAVDSLPPYNSFGVFLIKLLPGLRIRTYNSYIKFSQEYSEKLRPSTEKWDFQTLTAVTPKADTFSWSLSPIDKLGYYCFTSGRPYTLALMKSLYFSRTMGSTLASFAACSAYKKLNGQFPATLELAITQAKLPMPIDLATSKTIGYRLENGNPMIWFAGVDGVDNGGKQPYERLLHYNALEGKDLIFTYGQVPFN